MARTVKDLMNRQLFSCRPDEPAKSALEYLLTLGVHAAPVLEGRHCVGIVSVSNLVGDLSGVVVSDRMSRPALSIAPDATLEAAAGKMAESEYHHLVVCEPNGDAVGFVSALDVLRETIGKAARHPSGKSFYDPDQALDWSADAWLDANNAAQALDGPGVFVLTNGEPGALSAGIVWAEAASNVRERLAEILQNPPARVAWHLPGGPLSFRAAPVVGPSRRRQAFGAILARVAERG